MPFDYNLQMKVTTNQTKYFSLAETLISLSMESIIIISNNYTITFIIRGHSHYFLNSK